MIIATNRFFRRLVSGCLMLALCGLVVLQFGSCGATKAAETTTVPPGAQAAPRIENKTASLRQSALVTYLTGDVRASVDGTDSKSIEIGDHLLVGVTITTGPDSECTVQFADLGVLHLDANTKLTLQTIRVTSGARTADLELLAGSIANKVSKLGGGDRYQIRTPLTNAAVRGTEFFVKQSPESTIVAVHEGTVTLVSPTLNVAALDALAHSDADHTLVNSVNSQLLASASTVGADHQLTVARNDFAATEGKVEKVMEAVRSALAAPSFSTTSIPVSDPLRAALSDYSVTSHKNTLMQVPIEKQFATRTAVFSHLTSYRLPPEGTGDLPDVAPFSIDTQPADAIISVNGVRVGTGHFASYYPLETELQISVERAGFSTASDSVKIGTPQGEKRTVTLVSSQSQASGNSPTEVAIYRTVQAKGIKAVGTVLGIDNGFLLKDEQRGFVAIDSDGKELWASPAPTSFNAAAYGIVHAQTLYYAGDKELVSLDLRTGATVARFPVDAGIVGKRPLYFGGKIYFAGPNGLVILDASTLAKIATIALPAVSDMTPATYNGKVLLVDQTGTLCIVDPMSQKVVLVSTQATQPLVSSPVVSGSTVIFADRKGKVVAVSLDSNKVLWQHSLESGKSVRVQDQPDVEDGVVLVYAASILYALSLDNGSQLRPPLSDMSAPPYVHSGKIWYGTQSGTIDVVQSASGKTIYSQKLGAVVVATPTERDGLVAFPLSSGTIVLVDAGKIP